MEKGLVELQHVILAHSIFFLALTGDIGPPVQFMLKHLKFAGVDLTSTHIPCQPCDLTRSGGFSPDAGAVVLCQGNFLNKKHMEHTLVHELLHMYDHAVFNVDWSNLRYHACSEVCLLTHTQVFTNITYTFYKIRANSLSGDCSWVREIQRGRFSFSKQHQVRTSRVVLCRSSADPVFLRRVCEDVRCYPSWPTLIVGTRSQPSGR
jgi:inner membrane protease ATP23